MPSLIDGATTSIVERSQTPPISINSPALRPALDRTISLQEDNGNDKLDFAKVRARAAKKKKNKKAAKVHPAAPADNTVYGFQTPVTSGGEESDFMSTPRLSARRSNLPSVTSSPSLVSQQISGISALKLQMDALSLDRKTDRKSSAVRSSSKLRSDVGSNGSLSPTATSSGDREEEDSYEVALDSFVSPTAETHPTIGTILEGQANGHGSESPFRKMTAEDFTPLLCLGKGAFGTVLLVKQNCTGRLYAQKTFRKASLTVHKKLVEQTKTERSILESVNRHPFIVNLYYAFQDHERLYLILEYAQGGELFTHLAAERMFTEACAAFYMAEILLALEHLHTEVGVIYRDLKPENCLLDAAGHLLLTDFGLSKVALGDDGVRANSILGTIDYMAPEVVTGADYDFAVDYWSLGAIGWDLLTGSPPFTGPNPAAIQQRILKGKLNPPYYLSADAKDLLTKFLRKDPNKRLGGNLKKDLPVIKKHRFFRKIDWTLLERRELDPPICPLITDPALAENFSREFTDLMLSPGGVRESVSNLHSVEGMEPMDLDSFGGFSYTASQSLLETSIFG